MITRVLAHALFVAALILIAAATVFLVANRTIGPEFSVPIYLLINFIFCIDFIDLVTRLYMRNFRSKQPEPESESTTNGLLNGTEKETPALRPYAIVASVYNAEADLSTFLDHMRPFQDRLWVIDDASTDNTFGRLLQSGIHSVRGNVNRKKPAAIKQLLRNLPPEIETVVVVDPDIIIRDGDDPRGELETVIRDFQQDGAAACCPRIVVRQDGLLARLQQIEYLLAFGIGRKSLGDHTITSGVAIYRRDALESALRRHSLSVYAEDLRNALLMLGDGERIYYDDRITIETEGKRTFRSWFSQRVGWFFGLLSVYTDNFDDGRRAAARNKLFSYQFFVYMGAFAILFHPVRLIALGHVLFSAFNAVDNAAGWGLISNKMQYGDPRYAIFGYITYTILTIVAILAASGFRELFRVILVVPIYFLYCLLHLIPITIGYLNWITLRLFGHRVYRDHFQDEASLRHELESRA